MTFFSSRRALVLGAAIGFSFAVLPSSCGKPPTIVRCNASNCSGCCDLSGVCQQGTSVEVCGSSGATCSICASSQTCALVDLQSMEGGRCTSGSGGGGGTTTDGGTGGGTATGGGSATGGGVATGGGTATDGGTCGPGNCTGCCTPAGACITNTTPSRCGAAGDMCQRCASTDTCVAGACATCTGCIDINTGTCATGNTNAACGSDAGYCRTCDSTMSQTCTANQCVGTSSACNATNCDGCCSGVTCVHPSGFTGVQCGVGQPGGACTGCASGVCNLDAGSCQAGGSGGGSGAGGGIPGFGGGSGGLDFCSLLGTPCAANKCCQPGASALAGVAKCANDGAACDLGISGTCNGATQTCQ